jgi:hypothetical protein
MLSSLLSKLFRQDVFESRYMPKPFHLLYSLLFMGVGTVTFFDGWGWFGVCSFLLGLFLGITIITGMNWEWVISYWEEINKHIEWMDKHPDPELWYAIGYKKVPSSVRVIEDLNEGNTTRYRELPVSPAKMNILANKVLMSGKTTFSEKEYSSLVPNFRKVQKDWKEKGYLKQNNQTNKRLGYSFTKKGMQVLYEFASDEFKLSLKEKGE